MKHDTQGRPYARLAELTPGDRIELDNGFDCHPNSLALVCLDGNGLFFHCAHGKHYLNGQCDDESGHCIGVYLP